MIGPISILTRIPVHEVYCTVYDVMCTMTELVALFFLPLNVGTTFGVFVDQVHGLSLTEVTKRRGKAGVQCYSVAETVSVKSARSFICTKILLFGRSQNFN
jgi:hypothetical protein